MFGFKPNLLLFFSLKIDPGRENLLEIEIGIVDVNVTNGIEKETIEKAGDETDLEVVTEDVDRRVGIEIVKREIRKNRIRRKKMIAIKE